MSWHVGNRFADERSGGWGVTGAPFCSVRSADGVCGAIDEDARHLRVHNGAHPALLAFLPFCHVVDEPAPYIDNLNKAMSCLAW